MASHLIVGIHGFAPKPERAILKKGWKAAIQEGLLRNRRSRRSAGDGTSKPNDPLPAFEFELIYWADQLYDRPLADDPEPYLPAPGEDPLPEYHDDWTDELLADLIDAGESVMDRAMRSRILHNRTRWVLDRLMRDSERYNREDRLRRTARLRLEKALRRGLEEGRKIFLIGHSMGSVISYEVLRHLEKETRDPLVDHFVGLGSPMGFSFLTRYLELRHPVRRMPDTVRRWSNLVDRRDFAAFDAHLKDDFSANCRGESVEDDLVINGYLSPRRRANRHKAYGYLRTPELSRRIAEFLHSADSGVPLGRLSKADAPSVISGILPDAPPANVSQPNMKAAARPRTPVNSLRSEVENPMDNDVKTYIDNKLGEVLDRLDENRRLLEANGLKMQEAIQRLEANAERLDANAQRLEENSRVMLSNATKLDINAKRLDENAARLDANSQRLDANAMRLDGNTKRMDDVGRKLDENAQRLDANAQRLDANGERIDQSSRRLDDVAQKLDANATRLDNNAKRLDANARRIDARNQPSSEA